VPTVPASVLAQVVAAFDAVRAGKVTYRVEISFLMAAR
jgi:hypothetical protein